MADRTWKYEPEENNMLANIGEYIDGRMIRFVCEFAEPPTAEDAALMIAAKNATATPPADAALADALEHAGTRAEFHPDSEIAVLCRKAAAALRARSVPAADSAALAMLDGYMVVRKELTEQMKFNAAFNLSAQFGEDYAMQHKEFAFAVWDEFKKQAEGMLYEPPPALRARAVPECISQHDHRAVMSDSPIDFARGWNNCVAAMLAASKAGEGKV